MDVKTVLDAIAACLCAEVNADDSLCFCGVLVGDSAYDVSGECDDTKCGQAWVRLVQAYVSSSVGEADLTVNNCGKALGLDIEMGVLRCFPIQAEAPSEEDLITISDKQIEDMEAMRRAILCCDAFDAVVLSAYEPVGPLGQGGFVGGVWTFSVGE